MVLDSGDASEQGGIMSVITGNSAPQQIKIEKKGVIYETKREISRKILELSKLSQGES